MDFNDRCSRLPCYVLCTCNQQTQPIEIQIRNKLSWSINYGWLTGVDLHVPAQCVFEPFLWQGGIPVYMRNVTLWDTCIWGMWHSPELRTQQPNRQTPLRPVWARKCELGQSVNCQYIARENIWTRSFSHLQRAKEDAAELFRSQLLQPVAHQWRWRGTN